MGTGIGRSECHGHGDRLGTGEIIGESERSEAERSGLSVKNQSRSFGPSNSCHSPG